MTEPAKKRRRTVTEGTLKVWNLCAPNQAKHPKLQLALWEKKQTNCTALLRAYWCKMFVSLADPASSKSGQTESLRSNIIKMYLRKVERSIFHVHVPCLVLYELKCRALYTVLSSLKAQLGKLVNTIPDTDALVNLPELEIKRLLCTAMTRSRSPLAGQKTKPTNNNFIDWLKQTYLKPKVDDTKTSQQSSDMYCRKCRSSLDVVYEQNQMRGADEPMTVKYTCNKCNSQW